MTELRAADLSFTSSEAAGFLNQVMGLNLSDEDVAALEDRTEGRIAGLSCRIQIRRGHTQFRATRMLRSSSGHLPETIAISWTI
jgi:ATP/maltotriose-dependent transcriptional regulator MalT